MRKITTFSILILLFIFILFGNLSCIGGWEGYSDRTWFIDVQNQLLYPIRVETIFFKGNKHKIDNIQPNEIRVEWILSGYDNDGKKASKRIFEISVYRESDNALIMRARGAEIDDLVIYKGKSFYAGGNDYQFLFQIKEEDLLNKGFGFEDEIEPEEYSSDFEN